MTKKTYLVPKRRLKEFLNNMPWEERTLGELYTERKERGYDSLQILSVSIHHGVSNQELDSNNLGKKVRRSEDKSLYKHVYFGDLVLNMMRAWQGAIGVVKSEGMVSPAYIAAIPNAQIYPLFMDYCLRRDETIIQMDNLSYGVTDFRKRLYWDSFINVVCRIPSVPEQERITAFFTHLDNLITLQKRKLEKTKALKSAYLSEMFPAEGESEPKRRLAGFTEAWEQRKLGEITDSFSGGTPSANNRDYYNGSIPFIRSGEIHSNLTELFITEEALNNSSAKLVAEGDILYALYGATSGEVGISQINGAINQAVLAIKPKFGDDSYLITQWLKKQKQTIISTYLQGGQGNLSGSIVKNLMIDLPTSKEEQTQIGLFFKNMDQAITLHQRKLEKLQNLKKAYLNEMFA